jgi:hypothetical protein
MTRREIIAFSVVLSMVFCMPIGTSAQVDLRALPGEGRESRLLERYFVPPNPPVPNATRFVGALSRETETGRAGAAFFTSRTPPVGPRGAVDPDSVGWLGFGFAAEWGGGAKRTGTN